jgi:hypothetical protein
LRIFSADKSILRRDSQKADDEQARRSRRIAPVVEAAE